MTNEVYLTLDVIEDESGVTDIGRVRWRCDDDLPYDEPSVCYPSLGPEYSQGLAELAADPGAGFIYLHTGTPEVWAAIMVEKYGFPKIDDDYWSQDDDSELFP